MLARVNWMALVAVVIVNMLAGALWYGALAVPWVAALGKGMQDFEGQSAAIYLLPIGASILNAFAVAIAMQLAGDETPAGGVKWAVALWVGLIFPYALVHNAFSGFGVTLTLIDSGLALLTLIADGAILGLLRPAARSSRAATA